MMKMINHSIILLSLTVRLFVYLSICPSVRSKYHASIFLPYSIIPYQTNPNQPNLNLNLNILFLPHFFPLCHETESWKSKFRKFKFSAAIPSIPPRLTMQCNKYPLSCTVHAYSTFNTPRRGGETQKPLAPNEIN